MTVLASPVSISGRAASARPVLSITQGLHQGGRIVLEGTRHTLGSSADDDFILTDPGIAPGHLALCLDDDKVAVEALAGEVEVEDRLGRSTRVPLGSGYRGRLPLRIRLGEARLCLDPPAPRRTASSQRPAGFARPNLLLALGLMFICAFAFAFRGESEISQVNSVSPVPRAPQQATLSDARSWFEQQLRVNGFNGVNVSEAGGQLVASGRHEAAQKSRWVELRQAFDQRFGQQVMLHSQVSVHADVAKPRVYFQAVWFGEHPYVVGDGGKRLYPGAELSDGWLLERIDSDQVVLARGEERFTLTL
ncbi:MULTISPECIES: FHA domain-containing protein [unclassified Pseudomonas]|uniref:SctD/MshK family protein n=1 Tax=unclassified Pseudomonas TaxID=196821 RepID=UPI0035C009C6